MNSDNNDYNKYRIPPELSGVFYKYYDDLLIDDSLSNLEVLLICIYLINYQKETSEADYDECKKLFIQLGKKEENFRKVIYTAKNDNLIKVTNKNIKFLSKGIKRISKIVGLLGKTPVYVIKSGENFSSLKLFEEFLSHNADNYEVLLCDSHISAETLFPFTTLKGSVKTIRILTANIYNKAKFGSYLKKMKKEFNINIEVKENKKIHDRYIIFNNSCWTIGTSIKDLGNKDSVIRDITIIIKTIRDLFEERWNETP
ncbi:MAG: hypothetical protein ACTSP3_07470 [Candidatus Heimdallarchaeaceae archaeon]